LYSAKALFLFVYQLGGIALRNLRFIVSYDGTMYSGFQTQPDGNTIQDHIEAAIAKLTGEQVKIAASGRTDAGVHARGQVFNFLTESRIPLNRWCVALNSWLPQDITTLSVDEVPLEFQSWKWAKRKTYCYTIRTGRLKDVFQWRYQMHHPPRLNIEAMKEGLAHLLGEHDFTSFCSVKSTKPSHVRTLYEAWIEADGILVDGTQVPYSEMNKDEYTGEVIRIFVTGNGFLYNMVRIIVGTLITVGEGKRSSTDMPAILAAMDRSTAGPTAEAHGLTLWRVEY
jgi:tRNA pseudouridine38-40 synthase